MDDVIRWHVQYYDPMIEKRDEQIIGIHSPAAFSVAFPKLYDIIKYYADERTQKEEE